MIKNTISRIYFNKKALTDENKKSSRIFSIFEGCTARTIVTLTGGAYLVGFAKYLGASDQISGIITSIPVLAGIIMIIAPVIFEACESRKFIVSFLCLLGRVMLGMMIFIPLLVSSAKYRVLLLIVVFGIAHLVLSFTYPAAQAWLSNVTPDNIRGKYFGRRESCVLAFVTLMTLGLGYVLDVFESKNQEFTGFVLLFTIVSIFAVLNFIFLSSMKEEPIKLSKKKLKITDVLIMSFKNNSFRKIILLLAIWNFSYQLAIPFTSVYMVSGLKLGYTYITLVCALASITSVLVVPFWGKLADKKSWVFLFKLMICIQLISFLIWSITNNENHVYMIPFAQILNGAAIAGVNIAIFNLQCIYSPAEHKTAYLGVSSALAGLCGFIGTLTGAYLVSHFDKIKNILGVEICNTLGFIVGDGTNVNGIKIVFMVAVAALLICFLVARFLDVFKTNEY